jgi:hypothetical protein
MVPCIDAARESSRKPGSSAGAARPNSKRFMSDREVNQHQPAHTTSKSEDDTGTPADPFRSDVTSQAADEVVWTDT